MENTEKKLTAVEWYSDKLLEILGDSVNLFTKEQTLANHYALKQAKEMGKQQIKTSFTDGFLNNDRNSEQYYNETFKSE